MAVTLWVGSLGARSLGFKNLSLLSLETWLSVFWPGETDLWWDFSFYRIDCEFYWEESSVYFVNFCLPNRHWIFSKGNDFLASSAGLEKAELSDWMCSLECLRFASTYFWYLFRSIYCSNFEIRVLDIRDDSSWWEECSLMLVVRLWMS